MYNISYENYAKISYFKLYCEYKISYGNRALFLMSGKVLVDITKVVLMILSIRMGARFQS